MKDCSHNWTAIGENGRYFCQSCGAYEWVRDGGLVSGMLTRLEVMLSEELAEAQSELAEWRAGVRRTYWAVRGTQVWQHLCRTGARRGAKALGREYGAKVKLITVGPRGNVRPWRKK